MNRKQKQAQRETINWAARYHDRYVMQNGELHYCLACMRRGKGALQLIDWKERASFFTMELSGSPGATITSATDGDIVIARLAGVLPGSTYEFSSCKALRRKIQ
ncbi:MAG TPA: hypothetical protein ENI27_10565, partial [bacterium]|nr:hypothetical protein [bacterium]